MDTIKKIIIKILSLIMIVAVTSITKGTVWANGKGEFADFTAEAILPDNQANKEITYFDLKTEPNKEQELNVVLKNTSDKEIEITPSVNRAQTNRAGVVTYSVKSNESGANLKYNIEDIVNITETKIIIKGHSEHTLKLQVKVPKESFNGILVGGLNLLNTSTAKSDGNIKNYFAREIGIVIREKEESKDPLGNIDLLKVKSDQENSRNVISILFENSQPAFLKNVTINGIITKKSTNEKYLTVKKENISFAPNSTFDMPLSLNGQPFKAATYVFKATANQGERKWGFEKEFTITEQEAKKFNEKDVSIDKESIFENKLVLILIGLVLTLIVALTILGVRSISNKRKQKRRLLEKRARKKKKKSSNKPNIKNNNN